MGLAAGGFGEVGDLALGGGEVGLGGGGLGLGLWLWIKLGLLLVEGLFGLLVGLPMLRRFNPSNLKFIRLCHKLFVPYLRLLFQTIIHTILYLSLIWSEILQILNFACCCQSRRLHLNFRFIPIQIVNTLQFIGLIRKNECTFEWFELLEHTLIQGFIRLVDFLSFDFLYGEFPQFPFQLLINLLFDLPLKLLP